MVKVLLKGVVLADSKETVVVENNYYFPPNTVSDLLTKSETRATCPWKGIAHYYNVTVGDETIHDVAWYYPDSTEAAANIKNYVAFAKDKVDIQEDKQEH